MRDKNRIKPILELIEKFWVNNSDLRFSQMIAVIESRIKNNTGKEDLFYVEDDLIHLELLKILKDSGISHNSNIDNSEK